DGQPVKPDGEQGRDDPEGRIQQPPGANVLRGRAHFGSNPTIDTTRPSSLWSAPLGGSALSMANSTFTASPDIRFGGTSRAYVYSPDFVYVSGGNCVPFTFALSVTLLSGPMIASGSANFSCRIAPFWPAVRGGRSSTANFPADQR